MGTLIGLLFGLGVVLIVWGVRSPRQPVKRTAPHPLLARAGLTDISFGGLVSVCIASGLAGALVMLVISQVPAVALVFGLLAAGLPVAVVKARATRRRNEHAELWPDIVDNLASSVRAGLSLPEAIISIGDRGPESMREPFRRFARDYRSSGNFAVALDMLKMRLADPTGDRVVEALRLAREVGGGDLGRLLRALSTFLREDLRTRGELHARQSWTVNAARLAVAAPWFVLGLMSFQRDVIDRYSSGAGLLVLSVGAVVCLVAYRLMMRLGRLPEPRRVLA